jgi:hypothetical protein
MLDGDDADFFFVPIVKGVTAKPGRQTDINFDILDDRIAAAHETGGRSGTAITSSNNSWMASEDSSRTSVTARISRSYRHFWAPSLTALKSGAWTADAAVFGLFFLLIGLPLLLVVAQSFFPDLFSLEAPSWSFSIATVVGTLSDPRTL